MPWFLIAFLIFPLKSSHFPARGVPKDEAAKKLLPQMLKDGELEVQTAGLCLAASVAKLYAKPLGHVSMPQGPGALGSTIPRTSRGWEVLDGLAERIAALVAAGERRSSCLAARHFLAACPQGKSSAKVAAAVAQRALRWEAVGMGLARKLARRSQKPPMSALF